MERETPRSARGDLSFDRCLILRVLTKEPRGGVGGASGKYGGVAQLGEHLLCKQGVIGSNPFISTKAGAREGRRRKTGARGETPPNQEMGL